MNPKFGKYTIMSGPLRKAPAMRKAATIGFSAAIVFLIIAIPARADDLVTNGSFEITTNGTGQLGYNTVATGWSSSGYNFLFASGTADTTGAEGSAGTLMLWGPNDGSDNGLPASSPDTPI